MIVYVGEDVEYGENSSIAGGNANLYNHFGNQYGGFSKNWESTYLRIQKYHSWAYTQKIVNHTTKHLFNYVNNNICNSQNLETT